MQPYVQLIHIMRKTFLHQLFDTDKTLFAIVCTFILLQVFFTFKGVESFPFVNWGMYSEVKNAQSPLVYEIEVEGKKVHFSNMIDCKKSLVGQSLSRYDKLTSDGFAEKEAAVIKKRSSFIGNESYISKCILNDSAKVKAYPFWLLQYLADMRLLQNPEIEIKKYSVSYDENVNLHVMSSKTIGGYEYKQ